MVFMRLRSALVSGLLAALVLAWTSAPAAAQRHRVQPDAFEAPDAFTAPPVVPHATFAYESTRTVSEGQDAYEGYSDRLTSAGIYRIASDAERAEVHAEYSWRYDGDPCDHGAESRDVTIPRATRIYEGRTDLDDYDNKPAPLATWLWVPTTLREGDQIQILDRTFTCTGRGRGDSGEVILLRAAYSENRVDGYGDFLYNTIDEYQFDAATGFFLEETVVERASGTTEGMSGIFVMRTHTHVTEATYLGNTTVRAPAPIAPCFSQPPRQPLTTGDGASDAICFLFYGGLLFGLVLFVYFKVRKPRRKKTHTIEPWSGSDTSPLTSLTPTFAPYLTHFIATAKRTGDPVLIAKPLGSQMIVGLGLVDRETKLATIFTDNGDACEELRRALDVEDFFSEVRHDVLPSVRAISATKQAYNILETYDLLTRTTTDVPTFDPDVVTRMKPEDREAVLALSVHVHGVRGQAWFDASLAAGDLCFVARIDGQVVGFAMLTLAGEHARLHTNTVHHDFRGRGLGKELARARIHAAQALGATRFLTEVATWNVASLEVVRALGFEKKSVMYVLTSRDSRTEKKALRR
jgi:ribosomal-protein-alanine N-acetyltransferase